jgi:hypothetical protein
LCMWSDLFQKTNGGMADLSCHALLTLIKCLLERQAMILSINRCEGSHQATGSSTYNPLRDFDQL